MIKVAFDDVDVGLQVFKIISKFVHSNSQVKSNNFDLVDMDDIINTAWIDIMKNYIPKWDSNRGKLSVYLYMILKHKIYIYMAQVKYCYLPKRTLRQLFENKDNNAEKIKQMYIYNKNINTCTSKVDCGCYNNKEEYDSSLADFDNNIDAWIDNNNNKEFLNAFNDFLECYVNKKKIKDKQRFKDIIRERLIENKKLKDIGKAHNISDERVRVLCKDFIRNAKRDKKLKSIAKC